MKVALIALSFACFIGALQAVDLDYELHEGSLDNDLNTFDAAEPEIIPSDEFYLTRPTHRPTHRPIPTHRPTSTVRPTSTQSPSTARPTRRPRPPQIHHNAIRSQGPLSGRLTNLLQNVDGTQRTIQSNKIRFNFLYDAAVRRMMEDALEKENEQN